jgi:hypothetical protein
MLNVGSDVQIGQPILTEQLEEQYSEDGELFMGTRQRFHRLAYGRWAGEWRIVVRSFSYVSPAKAHPSDEDDDREVLEEVKPLVDASRELRLAAAGEILTLLEAIRKAAQGKVESLRKVTDQKK